MESWQLFPAQVLLASCPPPGPQITFGALQTEVELQRAALAAHSPSGLSHPRTCTRVGVSPQLCRFPTAGRCVELVVVQSSSLEGICLSVRGTRGQSHHGTLPCKQASLSGRVPSAQLPGRRPSGTKSPFTPSTFPHSSLLHRAGPFHHPQPSHSSSFTSELISARPRRLFPVMAAPRPPADPPGPGTKLPSPCCPLLHREGNLKDDRAPGAQLQTVESQHGLCWEGP